MTNELDELKRKHATLLSAYQQLKDDHQKALERINQAIGKIDEQTTSDPADYWKVNHDE